ncbi:MAG: DUF6152 family protein [Acidobacteriota bacterium]
MPPRARPVLFALVVLFPIQAAAHHHVGCPNDTSSTLTVTGRIVEVEWANPHVHIRLEGGTAPDSAQWVVETQNPRALERMGLPSTALKIGDAMTVVLWRAKDGSRQGFTKSITLNNGTTVAFPIAELGCPF